MRTWVVVLLVAACGGSSKSVAPPKPAVARCAEVADHMIGMLTEQLEPKPPEEQIGKYVGMLRERCEQDGWSEDARACMAKMTSKEDARTCSDLLTEAQQKALAIGPGAAQDDSAPGDGGAADDNGEGKMGGKDHDTRGPRDKTTPGKREDPCAGGE